MSWFVRACYVGVCSVITQTTTQIASANLREVYSRLCVGRKLLEQKESLIDLPERRIRLIPVHRIQLRIRSLFDVTRFQEKRREICETERRPLIHPAVIEGPDETKYM